MKLPSALDDPRVVRIQAAGGIDVTGVLGDGAPAVLTAGWSGWAETTRAHRRALLTWDGPPAWRMDVPLLLDDWIDRDDHVVAQRDQLYRLAQTPHPTAPPPLATITGPAIPRPGSNWALIDIQNEQPLHDLDEGKLRRWQATLSFGQVVARDTLRLSGVPVVGYRLHVFRQGETLRRIAAAELGDASRWREITYASGKPIRDPSALRPGDKLRLPPRNAAVPVQIGGRE